MSDVRGPDTLLGEAMQSLASRALTAKDPLTRKHAIYLLGMTRNPDCVEIFIKALRDSEKAVRAQATRALADIKEPAAERLISLLDDTDWKVRYRAAEALGMMKEMRAVRPLIGLMSDEKDHVRYMAVKALGEIGDVESIKYMLQIQKDDNIYIRKEADSLIKKGQGVILSSKSNKDLRRKK